MTPKEREQWRWRFAGQAMQAGFQWGIENYITNGRCDWSAAYEAAAAIASQAADALIAELERTQERKDSNE